MSLIIETGQMWYVTQMLPIKTKILISPVARTWLLKAHWGDLLKKCPHSWGGASSTLCLFPRGHPHSMTSLCWGVKAHLPFLSLGQPWKVIVLLQLSTKSADSLRSNHTTVQTFPLHDLVSSLPCTCGSKGPSPTNLVHANPCFQSVSWVTRPKRV